VAAPEIVSRLFDHTGSHRIKVEIAHQFKQIGISIDQERFITPLKEMAGTGLAVIDPGGVTLG